MAARGASRTANRRKADSSDGAQGAPARTAPQPMHAVVEARHGHRMLVLDDDGQRRSALTRARRSDIAVGDRVRITDLGSGQAVIESVEPRRNLVRRSDAWRTKPLAANVDQVAVVVAPSPPYSDELLSRVLIEAASQQVPVAIIANKADLHAADPDFLDRLALYRSLGHPVVPVSAGPDAPGTVAALAALLEGRTTLLAGQSGMGKSTLVNALVPDAGLRTQVISAALDAGRHTTTFTRLFELPAPLRGRIIDSPGFQNFGLEHLSSSQQLHAMPECEALLGRCRFHSCTHRDEPGCAIRTAAESGAVDPRRYALIGRLYEEAKLNAPASWRR
jgi:ribosome biogenesis GTPase